VCLIEDGPNIISTPGANRIRPCRGQSIEVCTAPCPADLVRLAIAQKSPLAVDLLQFNRYRVCLASSRNQKDSCRKK
jgi:hypothetical protein